jgi:hypothetical protein
MYVDDTDFKLLSPGFYKRKVREGLDELNYTTFFDTRFIDYDFPTSMQLMMPSGAFNIREVYVYNGDCCEVGEMQTVFYKKQFVGKGRSGTTAVGYVSPNNPNNISPLFSNATSDTGVCFFNVDNGRILFSDSCANYEHVRIVFNGTASDLDSSKVIPPFCKVGLASYVTERALFALKSKDPNRYRLMWVDSKNDLNEKWRDCCYRVRRMSFKQRKDLAEYLSKMNY